MFAHLHVHTAYSTLDGMCKIEELLDTAKELGQPAIAITDHGSTSALWKAQEYAKKIGIKLILGVEFYYERETDQKHGHVIVLAKDEIGLKNMFRLQEFSFVENFYKKPRITLEKLIEHKEGLIITTACIGSTFNQYLLEGEIGKAREWARRLHVEFGDDFYIEIQPNQIPEQLLCNINAVKIAKTLGVKVVACNDVHYVHESDSFAHEILLALQTNKKLSDPKRWRFDVVDFWLKSEQEMIDSFEGLDEEDVLTAVQKTMEIANKCNAEIKPGKYLTKFPLPEGVTERERLTELIIKGAKEKGFITNKEYMSDVQKELDVIDEEGYSGYFLVVQDYVQAARDAKIVVGDGRGSGAGSKVAYLIDITKIEPQKYNLLFERFMSKGRSPDSIRVA